MKALRPGSAAEPGGPVAGPGGPAAEPGGPAAIRFTFGGATVEGAPGQSIAAALLAIGIRSLRTTRVGRDPRGVFCGIGICFDCLVTVNGRPGVRACLEPARDGDVVEREEGAGHADLAC